MPPSCPAPSFSLLPARCVPLKNERNVAALGGGEGARKWPWVEVRWTFILMLEAPLQETGSNAGRGALFRLSEPEESLCVQQKVPSIVSDCNFSLCLLLQLGPLTSSGRGGRSSRSPGRPMSDPAPEPTGWPWASALSRRTPSWCEWRAPMGSETICSCT